MAEAAAFSSLGALSEEVDLNHHLAISHLDPDPDHSVLEEEVVVQEGDVVRERKM